jgi:hypothetical protein
MYREGGYIGMYREGGYIGMYREGYLWLVKWSGVEVQ